MSDASNSRMLDMYLEEAEAPLFLSGFFQSPPKNFHNTEKVEIDVIREDEAVAVPIQDLTTGPRHNESTLYTNKAFTPPVLWEQGAITAFDMMARQPGQDPFQDPNFGANATLEAFRIYRRLERKLHRTVEMMASQVLQTGELTLLDSSGVAVYTLDFQPRTAHMHTVSTTWAADGSAGAPLTDIAALADIVRTNGKKQPKTLIFGATAMTRFLANATVRALLDKQVLNLGALAPTSRGEGATSYGRITIGQYQYELWLYDGAYKHPQTGVLTKYVDADNVIMLSDGARLDLTFGGIPSFIRPDQRVLPFLPPRLSDGGRGIDLTTNAWVTPDGTRLMVSAGTRPLTIPTAIDTFARLNVTA